MNARFDVFARDEVLFLRDVLNVYIAEVEAGVLESDPVGIEMSRRLIREMYRSMKQRAEATQ